MDGSGVFIGMVFGFVGCVVFLIIFDDLANSGRSAPSPASEYRCTEQLSATVCKTWSLQPQGAR